MTHRQNSKQAGVRSREVQSKLRLWHPRIDAATCGGPGTRLLARQGRTKFVMLRELSVDKLG